MTTKISSTQQKIISFFLRHPEAFVWMVSEFYAFKPGEIEKHFKQLDVRLLSNNYYSEWDAERIRMFKDELYWPLFSVSCRNFADVDLIDQFLNEIIWESIDNCDVCCGLSSNPKVQWTEELIAKYENKIDFTALSYIETVPWTETLIDKYIDRWDWRNLSYQPNLPWTEQLISKYEDHWDWGFIELNENIPWTVSLVEKYFHRFNHLGSTAFETNEVLISDVKIIEEFADYLCWHTISRNPNLPWYEENLLERWKDRIDWQSVAFNEFLLKDRTFFEKNLHRWLVKPEYSFDLLSYNTSLPWSIQFIDRFIDYWNWEKLSGNNGLPWSLELIDHYIDRWKWGYFELSEGDDECDEWESGLIGNQGIPWNIDWIIRYEEFIDMEALKRDWFIWDKAFKPYIDEKMIDTVFRLI